VIIAKTDRLSVTTSAATINPPKLVQYTKTTRFTTPITTPRPTISSTPYYSQSKKSLQNYNYETDTGIQAQEDGYLNNMGTDQENLEARGYSYIDNDGKTFQISYTANEDQFQPESPQYLSAIPLKIKLI